MHPQMALGPEGGELPAVCKRRAVLLCDVAPDPDRTGWESPRSRGERGPRPPRSSPSAGGSGRRSHRRSACSPPSPLGAPRPLTHRHVETVWGPRKPRVTYWGALGSRKARGSLRPVWSLGTEKGQCEVRRPLASRRGAPEASGFRSAHRPRPAAATAAPSALGPSPGPTRSPSGAGGRSRAGPSGSRGLRTRFPVAQPPHPQTRPSGRSRLPLSLPGRQRSLSLAHPRSAGKGGCSPVHPGGRPGHRLQSCPRGSKDSAWVLL